MKVQDQEHTYYVAASPGDGLQLPAPWQDLSPTESEQCHLLTHRPELLGHASLLQAARIKPFISCPP